MSALPRPVIFGLLIELVLFLGAWLFWVKPRFVFGLKARDVGAMAALFRGTGLVFACMLFGWSVLIGALLILNGMTVRI